MQVDPATRGRGQQRLPHEAAVGDDHPEVGPDRGDAGGRLLVQPVGAERGMPSPSASRATGDGVSCRLRPVGASARVTTSATSWPEAWRRTSDGTAARGVPAKTSLMRFPPGDGVRGERWMRDELSGRMRGRLDGRASEQPRVVEPYTERDGGPEPGAARDGLAAARGVAHDGGRSSRAASGPLA